MTQHGWPAIALARACDGPARIAFVLGDEHGPMLGSVAVHHLDALATLDFAVRHRLVEPMASDRQSTGAGASAAVLSDALLRAFEALRPRGLGTP